MSTLPKMKIMIAGDKGGTGKSPFAYVLASYLGYGIFSNESSINKAYYDDVSIFLPEFKKVEGIAIKIPKTMPIEDGTVYDFAGEINHSVIEVAKHADIIIIPCTDEEDSIYKSANAMFNFGKVAKDSCKFILLATRIKDIEKNSATGIETSKSVELIYENVKTMLDKKIANLLGVDSLSEEQEANFKFFKIRENKLYKHLRNNRLSMSNYKNELTPMHQSNWKNVIDETMEVLNYIDSVKK